MWMAADVDAGHDMFLLTNKLIIVIVIVNKWY